MKLKQRAVLAYLAVFFLLFLLFFIYLFLSSRRINVVDTSGIYRTKHREGFYAALNEANNLYKNGQFQAAEKRLSELETARLDSNQKYSIFILQAACFKALGLYSSALNSIDKAITFKKKPFAYLLKGTIYETMKNNIEARIGYQQAIDLDPYYLWAHEKLGDLEYFEGNLVKATSHYLPKSLKEKFISDSSLIKLALINYFQGETEQSLTYCKNYLQRAKNRNFTDIALFIEALCHEKKYDHKSAEKNFLGAIEISVEPERSLYSYYYGLFLIKNHRFDEAVAILRAATMQSSYINSSANFALGQLFYKTGNYAESITFFKENFIHNPKSLDTYYYAVSLYKLKQFERSAQMFDLFLEYADSEDLALSGVVMSSLALAQSGFHNRAQANLRKALTRWPDSPKLINTLAYIILRDTPERFYETLLRYFDDPKQQQLNLLLAQYYLDTQRELEARQVLLDYVQKSEDTPELTRTIGDLFLYEKKYLDAINYYDAALRKSDSKTTTAKIHNNRALCQLIINDFDSAQKEIQSALNHFPDDPILHYNLGILAKSANLIEIKNTHLDRAATLTEQQLSKSYLSDSLRNKELRSSIFFESALSKYESGDIHQAKLLFEKSFFENNENSLAEYYLKKML